jgi:uncharacterized membrane protein
MMPAERASHPLTWGVFVVLLLLAVGYVLSTADRLPAVVATHFDAAGQPNAFMSHPGYIRFVLALAIGLPVVIVVVLRSLYSNVTSMRLPNSDYWLAPQRVDRTRGFLIAHGVWFGSLLVTLVVFVHWLELDANSHQPPHLSTQLITTGLVVFLIATATWIGAMMFALRRPSGS